MCQNDVHEYVRKIRVPECFEDPAIKSFIATHLDAEECSYCNRTGEDGEAVAVSVDDVIEFIEERLAAEFEDPVEQVGWDSGEGGWLGVEVYGSTEELFVDALGGFPCSNDELINDVLEGIGSNREWCQRNPYSLSPRQGLSFGWKRFCELVKHSTRFMFFRETGDDVEPEVVGPGEILERIGKLIQSARMVRMLASDTILYRARTHRIGEPLTTVEQLGPPPEGGKFTNRMNPAGIPMFYGALEKNTALEEVKAVGQTVASVGRFALLKSIRVIDLTKLPPVPSIFDDDTPQERAGIGFLREFVRDSTAPIARDDREHLEYVPTQIVTEYFRHRFSYELEDGKLSQVYGVLYPSSKCDGTNAVLFFNQFNCEGIRDPRLCPEEKFLKLLDAETVTLA
jgi:RES domain-containing protein